MDIIKQAKGGYPSTCDVPTATPVRSNHQSGTAIDIGSGGNNYMLPDSLVSAIGVLRTVLNLDNRTIPLY